MLRTWSGPEGSSHMDLCLGVPFLICMKNPEYYMKLALKEAEKAQWKDEVPIGCVIVKDDKVIARGHNLKETRQQAVLHAETVAIQKACRKLNTWNLKDCDLYVTLEPCMMCTGAIILSRIRSIYYGTEDPKGGCTETLIDIRKIQRLNHHPEIYSGIMKQECSEILKNFFKNKRNEKKKQRNSES